MNQSPITKYFVARSRVPNSMTDIDDRKRKIKVQNEDEIITIDSEDESDSTIIVSPISSPVKTSITPTKPKTPKIEPTPSTPNSKTTPRTPTFSSPSSSKYYSSTKKRTVTRKQNITPAKKNLSKLLNDEQKYGTEDESCIEACEGLDDKTIFLLKIINEFLKDKSLNHLIDESGQELMKSSFKILKPGMRLVCRLYWRKSGWYKQGKVKEILYDKKEVKAIDDPTFTLVLSSLIQLGWIVGSDQDGNLMTFEDLTSILTSDEIKIICKELKLKILSKKSAVDALKCFARRQSNITSFFTGCVADNNRRVLNMMKAKAGPCFKLSDMALDTLHRLYIISYLGMDYSTIREKRLELMLIQDKIGIETYPVSKDMPVDSASVAFETKEDFESYFNAHKMYEDYLDESLTPEAKCDILIQAYNAYGSLGEQEFSRISTRSPWLRRFTPAHVYIRILDSGVQELKKTNKYSLAIEVLSVLLEQNLYRERRKGEWYAERALILHRHCDLYEKAAEILIEGLKSDLPEEYKGCLKRRAIQIANQKNKPISENLKTELLQLATKETLLEKNFNAKHIRKQPMDSTGRGKVRFETRTEGGRSIQYAEDYCIDEYITSGQFTHGGHWESRIITTLFFLLFWDIIYTKPRGVGGIFLSHYQRYPLDMYTDAFYTNRKILIDDRLKRIENCTKNEVTQMLKETWVKRPECEISGISRDIGWENVRMVSTCLSPVTLAAICRRLAINFRYWHSGFPDLTLWNMDTKDIKFVEVKTDTDKPSIKQMQWMQYLNENSTKDIAEFCYIGTYTMRQQSRSTTSV